MKYFLLILFFTLPFLGYSQTPPAEFEIFFMSVEYRDSVNSDFKSEKLTSIIGIFTFKNDSTSSYVTVKGDFSNWKEKRWVVIGNVKENLEGEFKQLLFPVMEINDKSAAMVSFIVGPFQFPPEAYLPEKGLKFEATVLYKKMRYTFIGIY